MALSLIGAGFGRTGTMSAKTALEILGLGPCHHMIEVNNNDMQRIIWRKIAAAESRDWDTAFAGYRAAVDWPSAFYWRELADYYPEAKVLLTVRSAESWYESMTKTIFPTISAITDSSSIAVELIRKRVFRGVLYDKKHAIDMYNKNIADAQSTLDSDRLLTYNVNDGWEPLCHFLGVPIPHQTFPHTNSSIEFNLRQKNGA
ncbi:MAG TPA: sulfotransferase family protein [Gammaproteobacteria bacterium]|nr:sulfotransferase family protein [Gammaproteobacteria bacterium]|tara:strand:- start:523 stop:1128 length:606 start_codon:yes stop_codon:yes gene_type:complete